MFNTLLKHIFDGQCIDVQCMLKAYYLKYHIITFDLYIIGRKAILANLSEFAQNFIYSFPFVIAFEHNLM